MERRDRGGRRARRLQGRRHASRGARARRAGARSPRRSRTRRGAGSPSPAIDEKGLNVEAIAVFATLAPRRNRPGAIQAMVALQVAVDYLDSLGEQGSAGDSRLPRSALRRLPGERPGAAVARRRRRRPRARRRPLRRRAGADPRGRARRPRRARGLGPRPARAPGLPLVGGRGRSQLLGRRPRADRRRRRPAHERRRSGPDRRRLLPLDRRPHRPPRRPRSTATRTRPAAPTTTWPTTRAARTRRPAST